MKTFDFGRPVKICGKVYYISSDMEKVASELKASSDKLYDLVNKEISEDEKVRQATDIYRICLDNVLGKGSFNAIFCSRNPRLSDMVSLMEFINKEIEEWSEEQRQKISSQIPPERKTVQRKRNSKRNRRR